MERIFGIEHLHSHVSKILAGTDESSIDSGSIGDSKLIILPFSIVAFDKND